MALAAAAAAAELALALAPEGVTCMTERALPSPQISPESPAQGIEQDTEADHGAEFEQ